MRIVRYECLKASSGFLTVSHVSSNVQLRRRVFRAPRDEVGYLDQPLFLFVPEILPKEFRGVFKVRTKVQHTLMASNHISLHTISLKQFSN